MRTMLFFLKKTLIFSSILVYGFFAVNEMQAQIPFVSKGKIIQWNFHSKNIGDRNIDIWMPDVMDDTVIALQVLYMNDGQMLFDSGITWNHLEWHADESLQNLIDEGKVPPTMIVGIYNGGSNRHSEFFPKKVYDNMNDSVLIWCRENGRDYSVGGPEFEPLSDAYLKFIVEELKPRIDSTFFVKKDASHTFIGGSSMGGLISMYAICEYPQVFGGAMCFSTHWPGVWKTEQNPIPQLILNYMENNLPRPKDHCLYFDLGDKTLDALYPPIQAQVDSVLHDGGFNEKTWITRFFSGDDHSERSWSKRFPDAFWWISTKTNPE